jgi:heme A synthase
MASENVRPARRVTSRRTIRALAVATLVATFALIVLGSAVRVTDSGMGCKGWPLCSGVVGPIDHFHPLMEQSHRFLASLVTILIVALALSAWRGGTATRHLRGPATASLGVIVVQIVLGAVTVLTTNAPVTVALHLLVATLFLGVVTVSAVASFVEPERAWSWRVGVDTRARVATLALYLVVISGSVVVNAGAQAACTWWPACLTSRAATGLLVVQMTHRAIVLVGTVLVTWYLLGVRRDAAADVPERRLTVSGLTLLALQVLVGAFSAIAPSHTELADVHLGLASALWSAVVALVALRARGRVPLSPGVGAAPRPGRVAS